jgi:hypothetical protein
MGTTILPNGCSFVISAHLSLSFGYHTEVRLAFIDNSCVSLNYISLIRSAIRAFVRVMGVRSLCHLYASVWVVTNRHLPVLLVTGPECFHTTTTCLKGRLMEYGGWHQIVGNQQRRMSRLAFHVMVRGKAFALINNLYRKNKGPH